MWEGIMVLALLAQAASPSPQAVDFGAALGSAVPDCIKDLEDPEPDVRIAAALKLGLAGEEARSAAPALIRRFSDEIPRVRAFAALAAAECDPRNPQLRLPLEKLLLDKDGEVRSSAAHGLALVASPESVPVLVRAVEDEDLRTRLEAIGALKAIGPKAREALRALRALTTAEPKELRETALQAIATIEQH
jgi:HEAT repeat protein